MKSCFVEKICAIGSLEEVLNTPGRLYTFLNPVSYLTALEHPALYRSFDGILADGSLLVTAIRWVYGKRVRRYSFDMTSLAPKLFAYAQQKQKTLYLIGSRPDEIEKATTIFKQHYPQLPIVRSRSGYFSTSGEREATLREIQTLQPDFLIVGMGAPQQEQFLLDVRQVGFQGIGFTCGGFFHQTASNQIAYYPSWVDRFNLRFLYRFYKEKHTRKRYLQAAFLFPVRFLIERFQS